MPDIEQALEVAEQRLEAAIALIGVIHQELDDLADREAVVADIVDHWRTLTRESQSRFDDDEPAHSPLTLFTWDYVDQVEATNTEDQPSDYETSQCLVWQQHARRLRRKAI